MHAESEVSACSWMAPRWESARTCCCGSNGEWHRCPRMTLLVRMFCTRRAICSGTFAKPYQAECLEATVPQLSMCAAFGACPGRTVMAMGSSSLDVPSAIASKEVHPR